MYYERLFQLRIYKANYFFVNFIWPIFKMFFKQTTLDKIKFVKTTEEFYEGVEDKYKL